MSAINHDGLLLLLLRRSSWILLFLPVGEGAGRAAADEQSLLCLLLHTARAMLDAGKLQILFCQPEGAENPSARQLVDNDVIRATAKWKNPVVGADDQIIFFLPKAILSSDQQQIKDSTKALLRFKATENCHKEEPWPRGCPRHKVME